MIEGIYEGELFEGVRQGNGTLEWVNGDKYTVRIMIFIPSKYI